MKLRGNFIHVHYDVRSAPYSVLILKLIMARLKGLVSTKCKCSVENVSQGHFIEHYNKTHLGNLIHSQARLCHFGILQEIQRQPNEMPLNEIQLLPHILNRHIGIEQMPFLPGSPRSEIIIILERFDVVIWIRPEQHPIRIGVPARLRRPGVPDPVAQGVHYEIILCPHVDLV